MFVLIGILALLVGCGSGDAGSDTGSARRTEELLGPEIVPPKGPPPKHLSIRDIKIGTGPVARAGDVAQLHYITVFYKTGEVLERWWEAQKPIEYVVGSSFYRRAFEKGIEGMRVGGEREIIEPGRFVSTGQPVIHLFELVAVERADG